MILGEIICVSMARLPHLSTHPNPAASMRKAFGSVPPLPRTGRAYNQDFKNATKTAQLIEELATRCQGHKLLQKSVQDVSKWIRDCCGASGLAYKTFTVYVFEK